jgi:hypothetical protein
MVARVSYKYATFYLKIIRCRSIALDCAAKAAFNLYSALCRMGYPLIQANALSWALLADERRMKMCL